jgi:hypothetical protein
MAFVPADPMGLWKSSAPKPSPTAPSRRSSPRVHGGDDVRSGIIATANALGVDPLDVATAVSYETGGTFDPRQPGPHTQYGQHRGLIQFGEPQAAKYGVDWNDPVGSQLGDNGAVVKYLRDAGVKPGMGLLDIYSAINAGHVGRYGASDAHNGGAPGNVADKVRSMGAHRQKAAAFLGGTVGVTASADAPPPPAESSGQLSDPMGLWAGRADPFAKPAPAPEAPAQAAPALPGGGSTVDVNAQNPIIDKLNADQPGRYAEIPADQFDAWKKKWADDQPGVLGDLVNSFYAGMTEDNPRAAGATLEAFGDAFDLPSLSGIGTTITNWSKSGKTTPPPRISDYAQIRTDSVGNMLSDAAHYAATTLGNAAASTVPAIVGGMAGGAGGGAVGGAVAGPPGAAVGATIGALTGEAAPMYVLNAGDVYQGIRDDPALQAAMKSGKTTKQQIARISLAAAIPISALDVGGVDRLLKVGSKPLKEAIYKRIAKGIAEGSIVEGGTEGVQQAIQEGVQDMAGGSKSLADQANAVINSMLGGALFGGAAGGVGGAVSRGGEEAPAEGELPPVATEAAPPPPPPPKKGPLESAIKHGEREEATALGVPMIVNDPAFTASDGSIVPAGEWHGQTVTVDPDQSRIPTNMKRVIGPDGQKKIIGNALLEPEPEAARAKKADLTKPPPGEKPKGAPAIGATVKVTAPGIEPFMGTIDSYTEDGDAVMMDQSSGEFIAVPTEHLSVLAPPAGTKKGGAAPGDVPAPAEPGPTEVPPAKAKAAETKSELPPKETAKPALDRFPGPPTAGQSVIVDAPEVLGPRFSGKVESYEEGGTEALIRKADGTSVQVPVDKLFVDKRTKAELEAADLAAAPPAVREKPAPGGTRRSVSTPTAERTVDMPDQIHADLYDLGLQRQQSQKQQGTSQLDLGKVNPNLQQKIADELKISPDAAGQLASDYRYRVEKIAREAKSDLPQKMYRIKPDLLKRHQAEFRKQQDQAEVPAAPPPAAVPEAVAAQPAQAEAAAAVPVTGMADWWDNSLTGVGRKKVLDRAGIKRSNKTLWQHFPINLQSKIAGVRPTMEAEFAAELEPAAPSAVDAAAHAAATSPENELPPPTADQLEAGNFQKGHVRLGGLDITIEHPEGSVREGTTAYGKTWKRRLQAHYGYVRGTVGKDKEHIDVFIKPGTSHDLPDTAPVFVVDQVKPTNRLFDEHKLMIGYDSEGEAKAAYLEHYPKNWTGVGALTATTLGEVKDWTDNGDTKRPFVQRATGDMQAVSGQEVAKRLMEMAAIAGTPIRLVGAEAEIKELVDAFPSIGGDPSTIATRAMHPALYPQGEIRMEVEPTSASDRLRPNGENSATIRARVEKARALLPKVGPLDRNAEELVKNAAAKAFDEKQIATAREIARSIAAADGDDHVKRIHIAEALSYVMPSDAERAKLDETEAAADADAEKHRLIEEGFAANRAVLKNFKKGDAVEWTNKDFYREPVNGSTDRIFTGTVVKVTSKEQGTIHVRGDGGQGGNGYDVFVQARHLRPKAGTEPAAPAQPKGKKPAKAQPAPSTWKPIGVNAKGHPVFEDERGVRSYTESGIRITETVGIVPGGGINVTRPAGADFEPVAQQEAPAAQQTAPKTQFANNTIFTQEAADKARAILKAKLGGGQLNTGLDPEVLVAGVTLAGAHIEAGARKFAAFVKAMLADMGEAAKPFMKSWYLGVKFDPKSASFAGEMDSAADVEAADVEQMAAPAASLPDIRSDVVRDMHADLGNDLIRMVDEIKAERAAFGTPDAPNEQALGKAYGEFFASPENRFATINQARQFAAERLGGPVVAGTPAAKVVDEAIEFGVVLAARQIVQEGKGDQHVKFDRLLDLYGRQPNLNVRTSTSVENQAYSTPVPLAYVASRLAKVTRETSVLEPTAGNGALLIEANPAKTTANELDPGRRANLTSQGFNVYGDDAATKLVRRVPVDVVIANPPFGPVRDAAGNSKTFTITDNYSTNEIDHAIVLKQLEAMKDDGTAVLLVGGPNKLARTPEARSDAYNGKAKRQFYFQLYNLYNVVDHATVAGELYEKQGAGWPIDVIVIRGKGKSALRLPAASPPRLLNSWAEVKGLLDADYSGRAAPTGEPAGAAAVLAPAGGPRGGDAGSGGPVRGVGPVATGGRAIEQARPEPVEPGTDRGQPGAGGPAVEQPGQPETGAAGEEPGAVGGRRTAAVRTLDATERQVPYQPKSGRPGMGTLVPVNMVSTATAALDDLEERVGNIDSFVGKELGLTKGELDQYFGAEQVDGIGLAIDNMKRGAGVVIGDQTGVGKGRQVAAIIKWAMQHGRTPVFVTEKPTLYADMYRDLADIGIAKPRIFMTNSGETVPVNDDGDVLKSKPRDAHMEEMGKMTATGKMPDHDAIFTTYSQMQTVKGQPTPRMAFLRAMVSNDGVLILDESHNAGGTEKSQQRGKKGAEELNRAKFARELVQLASGVVYSSATYAKRPSVMDLYSKTDMRLAVDNMDKLGELVARGGVPMQQVVAAMLSRAGQYLRRERSFDGVQYNTSLVDVDRDVYESFSDSIHRIQVFSEQHVKPAAEHIGDDLKDEAGVVLNDGSTGAAGAQSTNFTSVLHNLISQMLLSIKADSAADMAINAIKAGQKPIITLANTMESFINEAAEAADLKVGDATDLNFRDLLLRYLERSRTITTKNAHGDSKKIYLTDAQLGSDGVAAYERAKDVIANGDFGNLPASPIDWIKHRLVHAGYKVGEITGRNMIVDYRADGQGVLKTRGGAETSIRGKRKAISDFNNGPLDALILNRSGSTGLSLHASEKYKDQRQRHMIIAQAEGNIDTHMQMLGRVLRTGQVVVPMYSQLVAAIPAEKRPAAVLAKKMASLNANTTASRESAVTAKDVPDFINEFGDRVAASMMNDNPELNRRLGSPLKWGTDGFAVDDAMRKVTGRIPLLRLQQQEDLYDQLESEYAAQIAQLEATGQNTLEAKTLPLDARSIERTQVKEPVNSASPFADGVWVEKVSVKSLGKPMKSSEVLEKVAAEVGHPVPEGDPVAAYRRLKQAGVDKANDTETTTTKEFVAYRTAVLDDISEENRQETETRLNDVQRRWNALNDVLIPGWGVKVMTSEGNLYGIVIDVQRTGKTRNPMALGAWKATIAMADASRQLIMPFSQLYTNDTAPTTPSIHHAEVANTDAVSRFPLINTFDDMQVTVRENRHIVTGNLLAGYDYANGRGAIINYTDDQGQIRQGILQSKEFDFGKHAAAKPVRFATGDHVLAYLKRIPQSGLGLGSTDQGSTVTLMNQGATTRITVPASKATGGKYYLSPDVRRAAGRDFVTVGKFMRVDMPTRDAAAVIDAMIKAGAVYEAQTYKDIAKDVVGAAGKQFSETPAGWGSIEGGPAHQVDDQMQAELLDIVRQVSGLDSVTFMKRIVVPEGAPGRADWAHPTGPMTAGGFYERAKDAIVLALDSAFPRSAFHESFHRLQQLFLTANEKAVLSAEVGRLRRILAADMARGPEVAGKISQKELEAEAFAIWSTKHPVVHKALAAAWGRLAELARRVRSYLAGRGFHTAESIFRAAKAGDIARRAQRPSAATPARQFDWVHVMRRVGDQQFVFDDQWQARFFELGRRLLALNNLTKSKLEESEPGDIITRGLPGNEVKAVYERLAPFLAGEPVTSRRAFLIAAMESAADEMDAAVGKGEQVDAGSVINPDALNDWFRSVSREQNPAPRQREYSLNPAEAKLSVAERRAYPTPTRIAENLKGTWTDLNPDILGAVPLNYFPELAQPNMTAVKTFLDVKRKMDAYRGNKHAAMDTIAKQWRKIGRANVAAVSDIMHEATIGGMDPANLLHESKPGWQALRTRFMKLAPAVRDLYVHVRDAYRRQGEEWDRLILDNIRKAQDLAQEEAEATYRHNLEVIDTDPTLSAADKSLKRHELGQRYDAAATRSIWTGKARLTKMRQQFEATRVQAPYFPLGRFGDYFVTVKDSTTGKIVGFFRREKEADRKRLVAELRGTYPAAAFDIETGVLGSKEDLRAAMDPGFLGTIGAILDKGGVSDDVMDQIWQRYLATMPELSVRTRFLHRKGTPGYHADALRTFGTHMFHAAHQMGRLKYGLELQAQVNQAKKQGHEAADQIKGTRLADELHRRLKWIQNPVGGTGPLAKFGQGLQSMAFVWFLGANPASAAVNLTQTVILGVPILGGRFGSVGKASAALLRASRNAISNTGLSVEEVNAMENFHESGLIDKTQAYDLAGVAEHGGQYSPLRAKVMGAVSFMFQQAEVINRRVTALAAYRMARAAGQNVEAAIDTAHDLTWKTHFDYSSASRPRLMQSDFARVALTFKQYQINMLYRVLRDAHQMFKGASPRARKEARYQLTGIIAMQALFGGLTAIVGYNTVTWMVDMLSALWGNDDDDPFDTDANVRAWILELLGPNWGDQLIHGTVGHYLGIDISSRIGMPDLWFRSPNQDFKTAEEGWNYYLTQSLGAVPSLGNNVARGYDYLTSGDLGKAFGVAAPSAAANLWKAYSEYSRGITIGKSNDPLMDPGETGVQGVLARSAGFTPASVAAAHQTASDLKSAELRVTNRRQALINAYALAAMVEDQAGMDAAIERIEQFNGSKYGQTVPIKPSTLVTSVKTRMRNRQKRQDGALIQSQGLGEQLRQDAPATAE